MFRRMVRSGGALLVLAVAVVVVGGVAPPAALAAATPGPGIDAAVDYTMTLNGEYPPKSFGPFAGGDQWGEWDHIFTAEWHQGSWVVSYGGVTLSAYCIQVNNGRHPDAGGGNPDMGPGSAPRRAW